MRKALLYSILFLCVFFVASCKKDNSSNQLSFQEIYECSAVQHFDSASLANKLIGTWKFVQADCMTGVLTASDNNIITATFTSNGTFSVLQNSSAMADGSWTIKMMGSNFFGVDTTALMLNLIPTCDYLNGTISLCDDQVIFSESYADGCVKMFQRE